jgi:hypothetical protein
MSTNSEIIKKRRQAASERTETPKKARSELGKLKLATSESSSHRKTRSQHRNPKVLCFFMTYEEPTKPGALPKDFPRLRSAEIEYGLEARTISTISLEKTVTHYGSETAKAKIARHLTGDITTGFKLCLETVREWNDIIFDMIAFDWHNMQTVWYRDNVPSERVFAFLLGAPGFLISGGIVDIPCTPHFYEGHLAENMKGSLEELFDITFLHEHELTEKCFLSERNEGSQHTINCKLTRKTLKEHTGTGTGTKVVLETYDKMIKDHCHDGVEDICMIRLTVKPNLEALPSTEGLRPHEVVRDDKKKQAMKVPEGPKTRNEGRLPFVAQVRPASVTHKKPRAEELDPTVDPSSTTRTQKHSSSSVAAAATTAATSTAVTTIAVASYTAATTAAVITAATAPTVILLANERDPESGGIGVSGVASQGGTLEATCGHASSSNTGMQVKLQLQLQVQVQGPRVVANKKTKQAEKSKSAMVETIAELIPEVLRSDVATVEGKQTSAPSSNKRANVAAPQIVSTTCIVDKAARKAAAAEVSKGLPPTVAGYDDANVMAVDGSNMSGTLRRKAAKRTGPCYRAPSPQNLAAPLPPLPQDEDIQETKRPRLEKPFHASTDEATTENTSHTTTVALPPAAPAAPADSDPSPQGEDILARKKPRLEKPTPTITDVLTLPPVEAATAPVAEIKKMKSTATTAANLALASFTDHLALGRDTDRKELAKQGKKDVTTLVVSQQKFNESLERIKSQQAHIPEKLLTPLLVYVAALESSLVLATTYAQQPSRKESPNAQLPAAAATAVDPENKERYKTMANGMLEWGKRDWFPFRSKVDDYWDGNRGDAPASLPKFPDDFSEEELTDEDKLEVIKAVKETRDRREKTIRDTFRNYLTTEQDYFRTPSHGQTLMELKEADLNAFFAALDSDSVQISTPNNRLYMAFKEALAPHLVQQFRLLQLLGQKEASEISTQRSTRNTRIGSMFKHRETVQSLASKYDVAFVALIMYRELKERERSRMTLAGGKVEPSLTQMKIKQWTKEDPTCYTGFVRSFATLWGAMDCDDTIYPLLVDDANVINISAAFADSTDDDKSDDDDDDDDDDGDDGDDDELDTKPAAGEAK